MFDFIKIFIFILYMDSIKRVENIIKAMDEETQKEVLKSIVDILEKELSKIKDIKKSYCDFVKCDISGCEI
jgi:dTDP-D-glucose 4,6-dehydratase